MHDRALRIQHVFQLQRVLVGLAVVAGGFTFLFDEVPVLVLDLNACNVGAVGVDEGDGLGAGVVEETAPARDLVLCWLGGFGGCGVLGHALEFFEGIHVEVLGGRGEGGSCCV